MRTLILALTVLLFAAPVWATVTITLEADAGNERKIWVGYTSDEAELIRAFALDITSDGNIVEVNDYAVGDDNGGYGIFPGSFAAAPISVNPTTGQVDNWEVAGYSPVAPAGDPDALGGIGTGGVTVEMGSLYDTAAPSQTEGILCSVTVDENATELCVAANAIRGNVVLESAAEVQDLVLPDCLSIGSGPCFPNTAGYERQYTDWVALGSPDCWCGAASPTLPAVTGASWLYQCDGDAIGDTQVIGWRVYSNDLVAMANSWQAKVGDAHLEPCADFDHAPQVIGWRVYSNDLVILAGNWQKKDAQLPGNCPRPE
jgi:hypothetical protein